jgi:hypothetical protein
VGSGVRFRDYKKNLTPGRLITGDIDAIFAYAGAANGQVF